MHNYKSTRTKDNYRVSAIVSTYNSEEFIEGCLQDLLAQTLYKKGDLEIVIIDSASEQNEGKVIEQYQKKHPHIVYQRTNERETLYAAWNRGIEISAGKYITNANTDDRHRNDAIETLYNTLKKNKKHAIAYGDYYVTKNKNSNFSEDKNLTKYIYPDFLAPSSLLYYQIGPQSLWRKSIHDDIGYFNTHFCAAGDWDFNIRLALKYSAIHLNELLGTFLESPNSITNKDDTMARENRMVKNKWRYSESTIISLYQRHAIKASNKHEIAQLWVDLGLRALEYYPPWKLGQKESDIEFSLHCFEKAMQIDHECIAAFNNMAILLTMLNAGKEAKHLLHTIDKKFDNQTVNNNLKTLEKNIFSAFYFLPSDIDLPSQRDLTNMY